MSALLPTRAYQQEMLDLSLERNIIIALDTGSGKTHIAVLRIKHELEREATKLCWFVAPTVALCQQQHAVISSYLPISVGFISGAHYPDQWKDARLWRMVVDTHRVMVSTPQVLLDALRHGYLSLGHHIGLLVFDEAHHAVDKHPYNMIMQEFYFGLPKRHQQLQPFCQPMVLGLSASPIYGSGDIDRAFKTIETNLNSVVCTPNYHRDELARSVHRPIFRHAPYFSPDPANPPFSTNLAALRAVMSTLDIENDPYVVSLRRQLARLAPKPQSSALSSPASSFDYGPYPAPTPLPVPSREYLRIDQKLSKVLSKEDTFTHKGLRDLERTSTDILFSIGPWAADWFIHSVVEKAKAAADPFQNAMVFVPIMSGTDAMRDTAESEPVTSVTGSWKNEEKLYLLKTLRRLVLSPVSYWEDDIMEGCLDKVNVLIQSLLDEKEHAESHSENEPEDEGHGGGGFSGLVFVQRRDAVLALAQVLIHHPGSKDQFRIGVLLGSSDSTHRHSMMDITRTLSHGNGASNTQSATLADFKIGEKNLIISTSVAEEGIDVQACGSVIRWDPPLNMASWVQSRGRARRRRSTFTLMYDVEEDRHQGNVEKWKRLEEQMQDRMGRESSGREREEVDRVTEGGGEEPGDWDMELRVEATGATINPHSAVSHLSHFCAVISRSANADNLPIYDIYPPEFHVGWHSSSRSSNLQGGTPDLPTYQGPWASTVTLPRSLPIPRRIFSTDLVYTTKLAAHRHAAFMAYEALYGWGLLNENLLPFTGGRDEDMEEEMKRILSDIERREGLKKVGVQMDPWAAFPDEQEGSKSSSGSEGEGRSGGGSARWYMSELAIDGMTPLLFFSLRPMVEVSREDGPVLYRPGRPTIRARVGIHDNKSTVFADDDPLVEKARSFSRMLFWCFGSARMEWDNTDYAYLVLPVDHTTSRNRVWSDRRAWLVEKQGSEVRPDKQFLAQADEFAERWGYREDVTVVRKQVSFGKGLKFVGWQWARLGEEEEEEVRELYKSKKDKKGTPALGDIEVNALDPMEEGKVVEEKAEVPYPLLIVEPFPPRTNFLHPLPKTVKTAREKCMDEDRTLKRTYLIPRLSGIALYSAEETEYAFLLPSVLHWLGNHLTVISFQQHHFSPPSLMSSEPSTPSLLSTTPVCLLTVALTAPVSGEQKNYQRLETLGDAVLKYVVGLQLYAEYPMWHEGYLTRGKDHAVSNVRLAKENFGRKVFRWIIRDTMLGKKWMPRYASGGQEAVLKEVEMGAEAVVGPDMDAGDETARSDVEMVIVGETSEEPEVADTQFPAVDQKAIDREKVEKKPKNRGEKKSKGKSQQLSTKVLADVVEALIGSAYEYGGFDHGYECARFFDLGIKWKPLQVRMDQILSDVRTDENLDIEIPSQIFDVERMIGYNFQRKILLIEALTHASYREYVATMSYERLEFLGDGILDMVVTNYLYHAPGEKEYSPGHMHIRKSAVVNGNFLAYVCLGTKHSYEAVMPQPAVVTSSNGDERDDYRNPYTSRMEFVSGVDMQEIYLWQCLLHSNQQVLDDQANTFTRYRHRKEEIRAALEDGSVFPWAALTRLQAPKFFSDMVESIIGAVYVDSRGDMDVIKGVLRVMGIFSVLERIVRDDVDVLHPVSRLSMWASRNAKKIEYEFEHARGNVACIIKVDGVEEVRETERYRGKPSQEEVKFGAAEKAIGQFKLRDTGQPSSGFGSKQKKPAAPKSKRKRGI